MAKFTMADILELSPAERIQLVGDIWDSIAAIPESVTLSNSQRAEIDRRLEYFHQHPNEGISWEDLKTKILGSK